MVFPIIRIFCWWVFVIEWKSILVELYILVSNSVLNNLFKYHVQSHQIGVT